MVFKKMLAAFGVGGPSVDTVLDTPACRPGGHLTGKVHLKGGETPVDIEYIALGLVTRIEVEGGDYEHDANVEFHRIPVASAFRLEAGEQRVIPFQFPVPWETPVTDFYGQRLHGMTMGLRTELAVARAVDKGDLDPVSVQPLPAQERILEAFARLGFHFKHADLEYGHIHGVAQTLPFYQEIEFFAAPQYAHRVNEVELTFVATPNYLDVILEADKRSGLFTPGGDGFGHLRVEYATAHTTDWAAEIDAWMRAVIERYPVGHAPYGPGHEYHHEHGHHGGPGLGGVVAGAAAGFLGGMIAGEVIDEIGDFFEGEED